MKDKSSTFSFGRNWTDYVNNFLDEEKLDGAKKSLERYLTSEEYKGKTLIDIGCGSGIFSFNALRLECSEVISFDLDLHSVEATRLVNSKFNKLLPKGYQWEIFEGNILDDNLVAKLKGRGDIVYSWGVLHHTGNMWRAIENASLLVKSGGNLIIAIYNEAPSSGYWLGVKKIYNKNSTALKFFLTCFYFSYVVLRRIFEYFKSAILFRQKPFPIRSLFERERGMSVFYDVVDWLGGYPYEYASFEEVNQFVQRLGFRLIKEPTRIKSSKKTLLNRFTFGSTGCNEFVFEKHEAN